jgi:hypothetical protein
MARVKGSKDDCQTCERINAVERASNRMRSYHLVVPLIIGCVACSSGIDTQPLDDTELTMLQDRVEELVQPFRESSNCSLHVVSLSPDLLDDSGRYSVALSYENESCSSVVSELNSIGTTQGLPFFVIKMNHLPEPGNEFHSSKNVDLIHEIDPADGTE